MIKFETVLVTPELAKKWVGLNAENNRLPKRSKIPAYARDMLAGKWISATGETIKFDEDGVLIDGRNRLMAVVMAGIPVEFIVATGVPRDAMLVIDSGAARTGMDALKIAGATDRARTASIVRWVILWDSKVFVGSGGTILPTNTEIVDRYNSDRGGFNAAAKRATDCQNRGIGTGAPAGVAHYLFSRIDKELTHQFFDQYISGANVPGRSAVLVLRNRIIKARVDRLTRPEQLALFIRAWNFWRKDEGVDRLIISRDELRNENFPQPK